MMAIVAILLLALDGPVDGGVPALIARFDGQGILPISAAFLSESETLPAIEWFLDGDSLLAPLAVSTFGAMPKPDDPPSLRRGIYQFATQSVTKPTLFRGVIGKEPKREIRLLLFPPDYFLAGWKRLAESGIPVFASGELPGLRPLLEEAGITFREADLSHPEEIDRNGLLIAQTGFDGPAILPGLAKGVIIFDEAPLTNRQFLQASPGQYLICIQGPVTDFQTNPLGQQIILQLAEKLP